LLPERYLRKAIRAGGLWAARCFNHGSVQVYAIIEDGGRQFKVASGDKLYVDLRVLPEGQDTIEFNQVLAVGEGSDTKIGQPLVEGAKVIAKVVGEVKGHKLRTIKFRRRKNYRRKLGHRQQYLEVTVSDIVC
jgi:large subunit ribosomal protein L21